MPENITPSDLNPYKERYSNLRKRFLKQKEMLEQKYGFEVKEMWSCQWEKKKKEDPIVRKFFRDIFQERTLK